MRKRMLFAGVAALGLTGCSVGEGFVAREWSREIRQLQIEPVFPPREDFHVGDVYLPAQKYGDDAEPADKGARVPIATWMTTVNLQSVGNDGDMKNSVHDDKAKGGTRIIENGLLSKFYGNRVTYPATGFKKASDGKSSKVADVSVLDCKDVAPPVANSSCNIFTDNEKTKLRRLRVVGFPTFLSTEITEGSLSAFVPAEAFTAALGLEFGDVRSVSVSVPVAESIGLPATDMLSALKTSVIDDKKKCSPGTINAILPREQRDANTDAAPGFFHMLVVTEVYYTRNIDISIRTEESFGLGANVKPIIPDTTFAKNNTSEKPQTQAQSTQKPDNGNSGPENKKGESRNPSLHAAQTRIGDLQKAVSDLPTTPGVNLQLLSVADGRVGMRRMFSRPIAIGYRGLSLKVKLSNQKCAILAGRPAQDTGPLGQAGQSTN
ncbi:hypothetical protein CKO28_08010 [Rhodovibrio sodomensis]|uniref:Uncharacterized protein n=1 Tax=Rhodovibrio sodomensis TaxID=1088 RepID=A0ABS1DCN1_9PROT|nr:hypothetical protein [Rhodovibrio sodomensis]MBK1667979.1 hypothetical protein [Rhodovibrio sodomensis]